MGVPGELGQLGVWWFGEDGIGGLCRAKYGAVGWADGEGGLFGHSNASAGFCGREADEDGLGVDGQKVGCGGEGDCDTGGFRGDVGVVALAMGEGIEL